MALVSDTYGKRRVRVMRIVRDGPVHEVRELEIGAMLTGAFAAAFTSGDNASVVSTDTVKNVVNVVARENLGLDKEDFAGAVAQRLLDGYPQVESATVTARETKWIRMAVEGQPHPHAFVLDGNGKPFTRVRATREGASVVSGVSGFTFMKTTGSGWAGYHMDPFTTLKETRDRICATEMEASWRWASRPADHSASNALVLQTMLDVFAATYSESVQDSLYRMGTAALKAVPELIDVSLACPNKHYLPINLEPFGLVNENVVFVPTDEPHGQIECTIGRD